MACWARSPWPIQLVLTKVDLVRQGALAELLGEPGRTWREPGAHPEIIATSAREGTGIERLRAALTPWPCRRARTVGD